MSFHFRPATRERTPLIIGLAGPTKSGKTYSAHRIAAGLADGGTIAMINAEGPKGHLYSDVFSYVATEIQPPYRPERYLEAFNAALALDPVVVIVDSMSHMHDGPGGMLEYHEDELDRLLGDNKNDFKARQRSTFTAWVKPSHAERQLVYAMLDAPCHIVLCFRAKEKLKIERGKEPVNMGWRPITRDAISYETLFTLILPPHSDGVPDMGLSEMRESFKALIPEGEQLSEETGKRLAAWAAGAKSGPAQGSADGENESTEAESSTGGAGIYATEQEITTLLEIAARVDDETHGKVVDAIARHRKAHAGLVKAAWLKRQSDRLLTKAPA